MSTGTIMEDHLGNKVFDLGLEQGPGMQQMGRGRDGHPWQREL